MGDERLFERKREIPSQVPVGTILEHQPGCCYGQCQPTIERPNIINDAAKITIHQVRNKRTGAIESGVTSEFAFPPHWALKDGYELVGSFGYCGHCYLLMMEELGQSARSRVVGYNQEVSDE